ncbi:hypothetical protein CLOSYM_02644 [[Clostridium] symbiosum ATCC 14940]|uniref:Uncharacterized protein n=1 Tax=[Clostridium] symbiosum ATCC 14940 TaxID=411472 RepID=A0ABC9TWU4_CLOSY|nr:hypothetical protein CLOSYM_02644 [[Clostridium] symbiosum ATCC 14940]
MLRHFSNSCVYRTGSIHTLPAVGNRSVSFSILSASSYCFNLS